MSSKRQQTMAKMTRERTVKERRARKLEKKLAKKLAAAEGGPPMTDGTAEPLPLDLNARYVDGGPPPPIPSVDTEPVTDANKE